MGQEVRAGAPPPALLQQKLEEVGKNAECRRREQERAFRTVREVTVWVWERVCLLIITLSVGPGWHQLKAHVVCTSPPTFVLFI